MRKKLLIISIIIGILLATSITAYAAFSSGTIYEKNMTMPEEIRNMITGG